MRRPLEVDLVCPKCTAMNRPGATLIQRSEDGKRATCGVCSHEGPIGEFDPQER